MSEKRKRLLMMAGIVAAVGLVFASSIAFIIVINESIEPSFAEDIDFEESITAGDVWTVIPLVMAGKHEFTLEEIANLIERWQGENPHLEILDIDLYYSGGVYRVLCITHRPHED